jgi:hypothetical protein
MDAGRDATTPDSGSPDSTTAGDSGPGDDSGDASCPPAPGVASFKPPTYVPAVVHPGACSLVAIATFVGQCGDNGTPQTCDDWINANVAGDGGAGNPCGNCIVAPMNNGAVWFDPEHQLNPNNAGCVQLLDPTQAGAACAAAYNDNLACEGVACDYCSIAGLNDCVSAVNADGGACARYLSAAAGACAADFAGDSGVNSTCFGPNDATFDEALTTIARLVCGGTIADAGAD